jgi:MATE family multidrug resistance protein
MTTSWDITSWVSGAPPADGLARVTSGIACTMRCVREGDVVSGDAGTACPTCCALALDAMHTARPKAAMGPDDGTRIRISWSIRILVPRLETLVLARLPRLQEISAMSRLAVPIVLAQVGLMLMGVVDTLMVSRVSAAALAAVALGNLYFTALMLPAAGTLMVLDAVVSQALGAGDHEAAARGVQRGFLMAAGIAAVMSVVLLPATWVMSLLRQPPEFVPIAASYVRISILGGLPFLAFVVLRQSLQAMRRMRVMLVVIVLANVSNGVLNWVFIYGHLGSPAMGAPGSAWATVVSRWMMSLLLLGFGWGALRPALVPWRRETFHAAPLMAMVRLGLPIAFMQALEYGAFAAIGVLMGVLGTTQMAAHQIAINLASLTFMVPLGIGAAAAVRVGHAAGAADADAARESARAAIVTGAGFMGISAVLLLLVPAGIAALYTKDAAVLALAAALLPVAGVFQVFDGIQAVCAGVLRGLGDTRVAFIINLAGFWLVGFPVSVLLGFRTRLGAVGLWWGFVAALAVVALLLLARVRSKLKGAIQRQDMEGVVLHLATDADA